METNVNVFPHDGGADINLSANGGFIHGSGRVNVPSGEFVHGSVGVSGNSGNIDLGHNFRSDRTDVRVSNSDKSLSGNVYHDANDNVGFGATVNFDF